MNRAKGEEVKKESQRGLEEEEGTEKGEELDESERKMLTGWFIPISPRLFIELQSESHHCQLYPTYYTTLSPPFSNTLTHLCFYEGEDISLTSTVL